MRAIDIHARNDHDAVADEDARAAARQLDHAGGGGFPRAGGPRLAVELQPGVAAAAEARAALSVLDGHVDADILHDVRLLVSELVSNSVRHSGADPSARVRLDVASLGPTVRVEVGDPGTGFEPRPRTKSQDEVGGWGLHLVERIAARWGVETGRCTRVWFEIDAER